MSRKRKRRRRPGPGVETVDPIESEEPVAEGEAVDDEEPERKGPTPSPFPPFGVSVARGMQATAGHPQTLATSFLSLLATWGLFVGFGALVPPALLAVLMAVSPAHVFVSDVGVALGAGDGTAVTLVAVVAIAALRAVTFGLLILLLLHALRDGRPSLRAAAAALPRVALRLLGVYLFETAAVVFAQQLLASFLPGFGILVLAAGIYLLVFVPIVAAAEDASIQESLRRGLRAIRLPGTRHLSMVMGYFVILVYSFVVAPFGPLAPATPSILTWGYALLLTFLHVSVLGAFVYRWLEVRDLVATGPAPRRSR